MVLDQLRRYRASSSYSPSFAVDDFDSLFRRYRASSSYLPRDRFQKRLHALRRDRDSSINLLGYGTSDTAIVLHRSRASSGYSLFRVSLAKQFAWFVKPLERTAPVIISNNQVELYGLGLNYETCQGLQPYETSVSKAARFGRPLNSMRRNGNSKRIRSCAFRALR